MEIYRITKPVISNKPNKLIGSSIPPQHHSAPKHMFNTMEEYNALAKQGRFEPSKHLINVAFWRKATTDKKMIINNSI